MFSDDEEEDKKIRIKIVIGIFIVIFMIPAIPVILVNLEIWRILLIGALIGGYAIPAYISKKTDGPMSAEEKNEHIINKCIYCLFCALLVLIISAASFISGANISNKIIDAIAIIFLVIEAILGIAWILTDLIRSDFPWGIPRVIGRLFRVIIILVVTMFSCAVIEEYAGFFGGLFSLIVTFLGILLWFHIAFDGVKYIPSEPKTFRDVRIFKFNDDVRKIERNGMTTKLKREKPGSNVFVDIDGNRYKNI